MYGKMQESGLTEIIHLICTSATRGLYPIFSYPEFRQGSPAHVGGLQSLMTDVSGNIPFLRSSPLGQDFDQYLGDISGSNFVPRCWEAHPRSGKNA